MKHLSHALHFCPRQVSERASSLCQSALASGSAASSARSPVCVVLLPRGDGAVVLDLLQAAQHRLVGKVVELLAAQIVVAPLHVADVQLAFAVGEKRLLEKRDILMEELFLQILGAGGNDHALAGANHGHQIGQSLARAGAGFDDQVTLFFQRLLDGLRHLQLSAAKLVGGMGAREHAAGREELVERDVAFLGSRERAGRREPRSLYNKRVWAVSRRVVVFESDVASTLCIAGWVYESNVQTQRRRAETRPTSDLMTQSILNSPSVAAGIPTVAIVGRPNVGKSTLFNRLVGSRRAIVGDEPGITRDRLYGEADWRGHRLRIVDTGGIVPDDKDFIPAEIFRQAKVALEEADAIIMVVDGRTELAAPDLELARLLIRTGKPLFLAVNKVDSEQAAEPQPTTFTAWESDKLFPVSAEHGRGVDDLLDAVLETLPPQTQITHERTAEEAHELKRKPHRPQPEAPRNQSRHHRPSQRGQVHAAQPAHRH